MLAAQLYPHTAFNPALGAVVSFVRRATLSADPNEMSLPGVMALGKSIHTILNAPLIALDEAVDVIELLEKNGWKGEHKAVDEFVKALLKLNEGEGELPAEKKANEFFAESSGK